MMTQAAADVNCICTRRGQNISRYYRDSYTNIATRTELARVRGRNVSASSTEEGVSEDIVKKDEGSIVSSNIFPILVYEMPAAA